MRHSTLTHSLIAVMFSASGALAQNLQITKTEFEVDSRLRLPVEEGTLTVASCRSSQSNSQVTLKFIRLRSTGTSHTPIIYLAGGPGLSGISALKTDRLIIFEMLRDYGDVIILDQRGTGNSRPNLSSSILLDLPQNKPIDAKESLSALAEKLFVQKQQFEKDGININDFNTAESAEDIEDLRQSLGAPKIILLAHSYGTHLALAYSQKHAASVEKMIMLGCNPLNKRFRSPLQSDEVIKRISALIKKDNKLSKQIPDFYSLLSAQLERLPTPLNVTLQTPDGEKSISIGRADAEVAIVTNLGTLSFIRELPQIVYQMNKGNYQRIGQLVYQLKARPLGSMLPFVVQYASGFDDVDLKRYEAESNESILRNSINYPFYSTEIKTAVDIKDLGTTFRTQLKIDVPTLFINGTLDGRTTTNELNEIRKSFSHSVAATIGNVSHEYNGAQSNALIKSFMDNNLSSDTALVYGGFDFFLLENKEINNWYELISSKKWNDLENTIKTALNPNSDKYYSSTTIIPVTYRLIREKKFDNAISALTILMKYDTAGRELCYSLTGEVYMASDRIAEATEAFKMAYTLNPANFTAFKFLMFGGVNK
jgi:pimeloyl-ACP methyl ester carboxylesterase